MVGSCPQSCECDAKFFLHQALSCKNRGFFSIRHNNIRNISANPLKKVCRDVFTEPELQPLTVESFKESQL